MTDKATIEIMNFEIIVMFLLLPVSRIALLFLLKTFKYICAIYVKLSKLSATYDFDLQAYRNEIPSRHFGTLTLRNHTNIVIAKAHCFGKIHMTINKLTYMTQTIRKCKLLNQNLRVTNFLWVALPCRLKPNIYIMA